MKYELLVFIKCSGPNKRADNIEDTITSFAQKNTDCSYKFFITCDSDMVSPIKDIFSSSPYVEEDTLLELRSSEASWATDFNEFFRRYKGEAEWILISHDDVKYLTDSYFKSLLKGVEGYQDKVGWITSTSDYYYTKEYKVVTDTFRAGFYKDFGNWGAMFQLHRMGAYPDLGLLDIPSRSVKVHGIMSAVMLIKASALKKVGVCEDWTPYTMLIDEDWSLEALRNNLWNVWVPNVYHTHPLRRDLRPTNNKWEKEAHAGFSKKWGFDVGSYLQGISIPVEDLREKYKDTNIPWSSYRNSYDWEFLGD